MRQLAQLLGGSLVIWLVLALPAQWWWDGNALVFSAMASGLCLVPMAGTLVWCQWAKAQTDQKQLVAVLGGTGLRMLLVLGGALALHQTVPLFHSPRFLAWVVVLYLTNLTLEVMILVSRQANHKEYPPVRN